MRSVRTNNDVEGWHRSINGRAGRHCVQFYRVVELLHTEASLVHLQMKLVKESKLRRYQKKRFKSVQSKLFNFQDLAAVPAWRTYDIGGVVHLQVPVLQYLYY